MNEHYFPMRNRDFLLSLIGLLCVLGLGFNAAADWDPGQTHKMHWPQEPDPIGWDICLNHAVIADDFECAESGPITDIHFWVSWQHDNPRWDLIESIDVTIYSDGGGKPGMNLWSYHILPSDPCYKYRYYGSGTQGWHCPQAPFTQEADHQAFYQINLKPLPEPWFNQVKGTHYWLGIIIHMLPDGDMDPSNDPQVGWKTALPQHHWGEFSKWHINGNFWGDVKPLDLVRDQAFVITNDAAGGMLDFGDAPDQPYPTLRASDGARHKIVQGMYLGALVDSEPDGQPTPAADGDDVNPVFTPDDEDGVGFVSAPIIGQMAQVMVQASMPGKLDAWIDFNQDGVWSMGLPEQIAISVPLTAGVNTISFAVPSTALPGQTYARFRYSTNGNLLPTGLALDGEVEDYTVDIQKPQEPKMDFGDAPDPRYPTLLISNGARHIIGGPWLGDATDVPDAEANGQPMPMANGDDINGFDDEDGVMIPVLTEAVGGMINVMVGAPGVVQIWIDWNQDGIWAHPAEQVFFGNRPAGPFGVAVTPPAGSAGQTFLRARISQQGGLLPTGQAPDGEVEDHPVIIEPGEKNDFGDAPDSPQTIGYPTLLVHNGARHKIGGPWLGSANDAPDYEINGQPTAMADGDNLNGINDENGVLMGTLNQGIQATAQVQVSGGGGIVEGWVDFNQNKAWEASEQVYNGMLANGIHPVSFPVPLTAVTGQTYARFRISTAGTGSPTGAAATGEVEDYAVIIKDGPKADLGDAPDSTNTAGAVMTAYSGVQANFPTVFNGSIATAIGPKHLAPLTGPWLGQSVSLEDEADTGMDTDTVNNINTVGDVNDLDGADDGLVLPVKMPGCKWSNVNYLVNVPPTSINGVYYVNIWCDWNRDGDWDDLSACTLGPVPEWAVRNQMLRGLTPGLHTVTSIPFVSWHPTDGPTALWMRITLSEQPWMEAWGAGGCGVSGGYALGETEDYLVEPDTSCVECPDLNCDHFVNLADFTIMASQWLKTCP